MLKVAVFLGAACAVVAASDTPPPEVRLGAGALAAGFGALVALLRPPTMPAHPAREERREQIEGKG